jgi:hypothetical protein
MPHNTKYILWSIPIIVFPTVDNIPYNPKYMLWIIVAIVVPIVTNISEIPKNISYNIPLHTLTILQKVPLLRLYM